VKFTPHDDQREAIAHLTGNRRAGLWMPMGGGKTVSTLTALVSLDMVEPVFPVLVLAPLRVARSTWPDEVDKWDHLRHLRVSVITGTATERYAALRKTADVYTMNYDNLPWLRDYFTSIGVEWPFRTVVSDESTRLKSHRMQQGGKRTAALSKVAFGPVTRFYGLTGTPSPNGVKDLWGPTWFLDKGTRLGKSFTAFERRWFRPDDSGYGIVPFDHSQGEIEERLQDICLTVRGEPVEEAVVSPIYVDLPPAARKLYRAMEKEAFVQIEQNGIEALNSAIKINKCLQIASGIIFDEDRVAHELHRAKVEALESIIEEAAGAPVLVSYNFVPDLERLRKHFRHARVLDTNPQTIRDWNAGRISILLAHPASAGHGLNLAEGGNILARFGFDWNLENYMQILERIGPNRQRQAGLKRRVYDYPIIARDTFDDVVLTRLGGKISIQEAVLKAMERRVDA
jgi:SNF2 family DNA or RNA helicase